MNNDLDNFLKNQDQYSNSDYFDLDKNINPTEPYQNIFNQVSIIKDNDIFLNFLNNENLNSIINDLVEKIENSKNFNSLDNSMVNFELFKDLCEKNPQIIDYFKLRDDFIEFASNKKNDQFLMN